MILSSIFQGIETSFLAVTARTNHDRSVSHSLHRTTSTHSKYKVIQTLTTRCFVIGEIEKDKTFIKPSLYYSQLLEYRMLTAQQ